MDLSIVVPVYRSERLLPELVRRVDAAVAAGLPDKSYELILVNDCSPDRSWQVIEQACRDSGKVKGVNLRRNSGQHNSIMAGLRHASGRMIIVMDDDLQHAPEDIPKLYASVLDGYDLCYAAFRHPNHALWKRAGSAFRDLTAGLLLGVPRGVRISSFKGMKAEIAADIVRYEGAFPYVDGLAFMVTHNAGNVELEHHPRPQGQGNYGLRESVLLWTRVAMNFSVVPLRLAAWLGVALARLRFVFCASLVFSELGLRRL